jgi:predicted acetyltransferase
MSIVNDHVVSTVRVFNRTVYMNGVATVTGGIGEVSTQSAFRSRGFAKQLMNVATQYMTQVEYNNQRIILFSLHVLTKVFDCLMCKLYSVRVHLHHYIRVVQQRIMHH